MGQGGACAVNFEHVYHCAHELLFTFEPAPSPDPKSFDPPRFWQSIDDDGWREQR